MQLERVLFMKMFLDANKPLHTCKEGDCDICDVRCNLHCHFGPQKLLAFLSLGFPLLILGGIITFRFSFWAFVPWIIFTVSYFGLIEIRVLCSHCPHYAEPSLKSLKCWANYGSPKPWKYNPGPMSVIEKVVFFAGGLIVFLLPIISAILSGNLILLAVFAVLITACIFVLSRFYCNKCMNFACPFNRVDQAVRDQFFKHNPIISDAWHKAGQRPDRH
jgi:hypothetical protein